jgi:hypothetical protein
MFLTPGSVAKVRSARGSQLTDRYSLTGFGPALERAAGNVRD